MHLSLAQDAEQGFAPSVIIVGLLGMIISVLSNIEAAEEMYPLYLQKKFAEQANSRSGGERRTILWYIPTSVQMAFFSDACLSVYGIYHKDILIGLYGALNSLVILFTIFSIFEKNNSNAPQAMPYIQSCFSNVHYQSHV